MKNFKIISVGNGAMFALNYMIDCGLTGAEFIACSTYEYGLQMSKADKKVWINEGKPLGLGADLPERSMNAAIKSREEILSALRGADVVIIVACLGGSDGTGASPIIAEYAREVGALTVAVVTLPYRFEGVRRTARAEDALKNLSAHVDTLIKIQNDDILQNCDPKTTITAAFKCVDEVLYNTVKNLLCLSADDNKKFSQPQRKTSAQTLNGVTNE